MISLCFLKLGNVIRHESYGGARVVSRKTLEKIIGRAAMDPQFRHRMAEEPEVALKEYSLTEEQITAIKAIPTDALERFSLQLMGSIGKEVG